MSGTLRMFHFKSLPALVGGGLTTSRAGDHKGMPVKPTIKMGLPHRRCARPSSSETILTAEVMTGSIFFDDDHEASTRLRVPVHVFRNSKRGRAWKCIRRIDTIARELSSHCARQSRWRLAVFEERASADRRAFLALRQNHPWSLESRPCYVVIAGLRTILREAVLVPPDSRRESASNFAAPRSPRTGR